MQVDFASSFIRVCCELTICSLRKINFCFNLWSRLYCKLFAVPYTFITKTGRTHSSQPPVQTKPSHSSSSNIPSQVALAGGDGAVMSFHCFRNRPHVKICRCGFCFINATGVSCKFDKLMRCMHVDIQLPKCSSVLTLIWGSFIM